MKQKKRMMPEQLPLTFPPKKVPVYDAGDDPIPTDVLGSYTGNPVDCVQPEQDADDL